MDTLDRLRSHFDEQGSLPLPNPPRVDQIVERGRRHRTRTQMATALASVGVVAVVALGISTIDAPLPALDDPNASTADVATDPAGGSPLEFTTVKGTVGLTKSVQFAADGTLYALSTAPGEREFPADGSPPAYAVWSSSDGGAEWSETALGDFGGSLWAQDMTISDAGLYVVGTAPATADSGVATVRVGRSDDGGETWSPIDLTLAASPPMGMGEVVGQSTATRVAASPSATVVIAETSFWIDASSLVPDDIRNQVGADAAYPEVIATGLRLYDWTEAERLEMGCAGAQIEEETTATTAATVDDAELPAECAALEAWEPEVLWEATWEELGVEPQPMRYTEAFVATGDGFSPVDFPGAVADIRSIHWLDNAFYAVAGADPMTSEVGVDGYGAEIIRSEDGTTWSKVGELSANGGWISEIGSVDGRLVTLVQGGRSPFQVFVSDDDGSSWLEIDLEAALPEALPAEAWTSSWGTGELGVVIAVTAFDGSDESDPRSYLLQSNDLESWSVTESDLTYSDAIAVGAEGVWVNGGAWTPSRHSHLVGRPAR